ncbi:LacI family DNA-binding transcriptional regulator [Bacillota bacterium Meth-B3]
MGYTISDIARMAGVSKATVSRVINDKSEGVGEATKLRIQQLIREIDYHPNSLARSVAIARSNTIGVVIPDIGNHFYNTVLRGIDDYISAHGYSMLLCNSDNDPQKEQQHLMRFADKRVDGVILCSGLSNEEFLRGYRRFEIPTVLIGRKFDTYVSDAGVTGDNVSGALEAVGHLIRGGNRHILYLDGVPGTSGCIGRLEGYRRAMERAGLPARPEYIRQGDFSVEYGHRAILGALDEGLRFDAVFSGSDLAAIGAIRALTERGVRVPEEIEVIGFDDLDFAGIFEPPLSTVAKPHYTMAKEAARMLLGILNGDDSCRRHTVFASSLVLRKTTRPVTP